MTQKPLLMGSAVIGLTLPIHVFVPEPVSVQIAALLMALIAGAYIGFGAADGRMSAFLTEFAGAGLFGGAALAGLIVHPLIIPAAIIAHAGWDWLHHAGFGARIPGWYVPFCVWIDLAVGAGLIALWTLH
ncbi:MAG: hypothetical protein AAFO88_05670 [Pseudomonadota bacterium]